MKKKQKPKSIKTKQKPKSIKTKLILYCGALLILSSVINTTISIISTKNSMLQSEQVKLEKCAARAAQIVDNKLEEQIEVLKTIARRKEFVRLQIGEVRLQNMLDEECEFLGFRNIYIADIEGNMIITRKNIEDVSEDPIFQAALRGESVYSSPMLRDGVALIQLATPVYDENGDVFGILIATQDIMDFNQEVMDQDYTSFILGSNGDYLAHSDASFLSSVAQSEMNEETTYPKNEKIHEIMVQGEAGFSEYVSESTKEKCYIAYAPITTNGWSIGILEPVSFIDNLINEQILRSAISSAVILIIAFLGIYFLSSIIVRQIKAITNHLNVMAKGDFKTQTPKKLLSNKDELGFAANAMEQMRTTLAGMIHILKDSTNQMQTESTSLSQISSDAKVSSEGIAIATHQMATGVSEQAEDLVNILKVINEFGEKIETIVSSIGEVEKHTATMKEEASSGNKNTEELSLSVAQVKGSFENFYNRINGLSNNIKNVTEITKLIDEIAEQTNLLALNASIEAARVGEAGKGFAVVADEIRKLAEQCKNSAKGINELVANISMDTRDLCESSNSLQIQLDEQMNTIQTTVSTFQSMNISIVTMVEHIKNISDDANEVDENKNSIITRVENVTAVGEEISASTEEVSATAENMKTTSENVNDTAQQLGQIAIQISSEIDKFSIE